MRAMAFSDVSSYSYYGMGDVTSDSSMNVAQWFDYAPYGSVIATTNTGQTTAGRQFEGLFTDATNLVYSNARYLNPTQGQFITQDPVFLALGNPNQIQRITQQQQFLALTDPQKLNAYSYGRDNPVTLEDPSGDFIPFIVALGAIFEAYSLAQGGVDTYDYYNMNIKYADVTTQQEKDDAKLKLVFDAVSGVTEQGLERAGLQVSGLAFSALSAAHDTLDTFGPSVYSYNSNVTTNGNALSPSISVLTGSWAPWPTIIQQEGITYYRNSSGLLTATPQSQVTTTSNASVSSGGGGYGAPGTVYTNFIPANSHTACGTLCQ
jgi:RHS repeat-associated protein